MKKLLPIGTSDYKDVIDNNFYYVDKTLLIKELLETSGKVLLIPRPRRFGKSLNLSMLRYFFEISKSNNQYLFQKTKVWQYAQYHDLCGIYPVIYLTFKSVKEDNFKSTYEKITYLIADEFKRYYDIIENSISVDDLETYNQIKYRKSDEATIHNSLKFLTGVLYKKFNSKVIILIDEYDAPIHAAFNKEHYEKTVHLIRSIFTAALKDNDEALERAILTGITRVAKESIFSGLNNLVVCSVLDNRFKDKFGFTQEEVEELLIDQNLQNTLGNLREWYNGYNFSGTTIYNPWSILSCVANNGDIRIYWANTSDNKILEKIILYGSTNVKKKFELLLSDVGITEIVNEGIIFPGIEKNPEAIWSLLLYSGYLTCRIIDQPGKYTCCLVIPNKEIKIIFDDFISDIFKNNFSDPQYSIDILNYLTKGDIEDFSKLFSNYVANSVSFHDINGYDSENSYHLFVLGMLVLLNKTYQIKSNRGSGYGRHDIMLIPREKNKLGLIIEFKKVDSKESLESAAQNALKQIKNKNYIAELRDIGIKNVKALGIAFKGKQSLVLSEDL